MENEKLNELWALLDRNNTGYIKWFNSYYDPYFNFKLITMDVYNAVMEGVLGITAAEAELIDSKGLSVLHRLVLHNYYDAVEGLLKAGANPNVRGGNSDDGKGVYSGTTPFLLACFMGNYNMAELLAEYGADTSATDDSGRNAFHYIASYYEFFVYEDFEVNSDIMRQKTAIIPLIKADINAKDVEGRTPLIRLLTYRSESYNANRRLLVQPFIDNGADVTARDNDGNTTLILAAKGKFITGMYILSQYSELLNLQNDNKDTALHCLISQSYYFAQVYLLYSRGMSADIANSDGQTVRQILERGNKDNLWMIDDNWKPKNEEFKEWAEYVSRSSDWYLFSLEYLKKWLIQLDTDDDDDMEEARYLINHFAGAGIEQLFDVLAELGFDLTQLIYHGSAATCFRDELIDKNLRNIEDLFILEKMAEYNTDLNSPGWKNRTPACVYAMRNSDICEELPFKVTKYFTKESFECRDDNKMAAIHYAALYNSVNKLKAMLEAGVDINLTGDKGRTPLHIACIHGSVEAVELLVEYGADEKIRDSKGSTAAHYAVSDDERKKSETVMVKLISALAVIDMPDNDGRTPFAMAMRLKSEQLAETFIDRGADINHADNDGRTPLLTLLYYHGGARLGKMLVKNGADINDRDKNGSSALFYVAKAGDIELTRYLLKKGADYNVVNNKRESVVDLVIKNGWADILELMPDIMVAAESDNEDIGVIKTDTKIYEEEPEPEEENNLLTESDVKLLEAKLEAEEYGEDFEPIRAAYTANFGEENGLRVAKYIYKMSKMAADGSAEKNREEYTKLALAYQSLMQEIMKDMGN